MATTSKCEHCGGSGKLDKDYQIFDCPWCHVPKLKKDSHLKSKCKLPTPKFKIGDTVFFVGDGIEDIVQDVISSVSYYIPRRNSPQSHVSVYYTVCGRDDVMLTDGDADTGQGNVFKTLKEVYKVWRLQKEDY